jgi:hypothetical protein
VIRRRGLEKEDGVDLEQQQADKQAGEDAEAED